MRKRTREKEREKNSKFRNFRLDFQTFHASFFTNKLVRVQTHAKEKKHTFIQVRIVVSSLLSRFLSLWRMVWRERERYLRKIWVDRVFRIEGSQSFTRFFFSFHDAAFSLTLLSGKKSERAFLRSDLERPSYEQPR